MPLSSFHPLVRDWFLGRYPAPTPVQAEGWAALGEGRHALLCAPTGSGKTLAAFLSCIDRLVRAATAGPLPARAQVVYVSPLKALSADIHRNLEVPLQEIAALAAARGIELAPIAVAVRTGDTPAKERARWAKSPPQIWITTPESLFILLGSERGRASLAAVETLILDEIHAVARDKRGAHLALSVERLEQLVGRPLHRIGLSATVTPLDEMARLLVGRRNVDTTGTPACAIIDRGRRRPIDLRIEVPGDELGPIASHELWAQVLDRIAELARAQRTTLVFTNTRRLVERVAHLLSERLGEDAVVAHHGSLSKEIRHTAETRLKQGDVKVCVATASLELGIDVGTIDLVCHIGSPRSVALCLQRVGRSGHTLTATPVGRLFPLTRDELMESAALVKMALAGELDPILMPTWPLDVLAQQLAAATEESTAEDELYELVTRAWVYRALPRAKFDQVIGMLAEGFDPSRGRRSALLLRDEVNGTVRARRGARLATLTSGGAIPDNADYDVLAEPDGHLVGRLNEDFAIESSAGDVFLLGNTSWRVRRVERGAVRVDDARGQPPTVPFWLGEAPARTRELSRAVGALRTAIDGCGEEAAAALLAAGYGLDPIGAAQLIAYVAEGRRVLGVVPSAERIVAERFFDEAGGMQLVIHAPLGGRINRAWGMALRKSFCRSYDFELQAAATDDGINLSLGPQHSFPLQDIFDFVSSQRADEVLLQAVLQAPLFTTRFRWAASRALAVARWRGGRKVPPVLQRMRSDDLLTAIFPAQTACQDNAPHGDIVPPDHPLVFESLRDCLTEALDSAGLVSLLQQIESGAIELVARDTPQPSVFAHQILNAMPYAFLDDAPLEERRARMVSLRRALPEDARDLGRLDGEALRTADADAWPDPRDPDELHDAFLSLVLVGTDEISRFGAEAGAWLTALTRARRVQIAGQRHLAATERIGVAIDALAGDADAILEVVRGRSAACGPFTAESLASRLGLASAAVDPALLRLESEGLVLRGAFTAPGVSEWCDRRILARIHRATIAKLRREIEPVSTEVFLRFLCRWQGLVSSDRESSGESAADRLRNAIDILQGYETAAAAWESGLLPARVGGYRSEDLDRLCYGGEVVWGRFSSASLPDPTSERPAGLTRVARMTLAHRQDLPWLLDPSAEPIRLTANAERVRSQLEQRGALFAQDLGDATGLRPAELAEALIELVATGLASADSFAPLRKLTAARDRPGRQARRFSRRTQRASTGDGRFWLLRRPAADATTARDATTATAPDTLEARAAQLLRRYGVLFRDLAVREPQAPSWRELLGVLRRAEARGEVRGGRFVAGRTGEQFALAEAVDQLRKVRNAEPDPGLIVISACDPLNLTGILTAGPRVPAIPDHRLVLRRGIPIAWSDGSGNVHLRGGGEAEENAARGALAGGRRTDG